MERNTIIRLLWLMMILSVVTGCLRNVEDVPFDDASMDMLSRSGKHFISIGKPCEHLIYDIPDEQKTLFDGLITALHPIKTTKKGRISQDDTDYILSFQPSRNPLRFYVKMSEGQMIFSDGNYTYEGGDANTFQRIIETILEKSESKKGDFL